MSASKLSKGSAGLTIPPVEFVEVTRKFAFQCPAHGLQLLLDLTPYSFYHV